MLVPTPCNSTQQPEVKQYRAAYGIVGIGNPLMGDDGAGIVAIEMLQSLAHADRRCFFYALRNDLFEIAEIIGRANRFIFIDAYIGKPAGTVTVFSHCDPVPVPSLHQCDIGTVMRMLEPLGLIDPFPAWELWGIAVEPPFDLGAQLTGPVRQGVKNVVSQIAAVIRSARPHQAPGQDHQK